MFYFAYGSNMDCHELKKPNRCPGAQFICIGYLKDHKLMFTRKSINRDCGVADAVSVQGENVWGVVYQIPNGEIGNLDKVEGFQQNRNNSLNAYNREKCEVIKENGERFPDPVFTYFVNKKEDEAPPPSTQYMQHLIQGAKIHGLPNEYIKFLERIGTSSK